MTISLLRRIWQQINSQTAADPTRQRLTGFEYLEPRMVLSGTAAFLVPDYFSPPRGDFSHMERSGAEIARPAAEFGGYSDYNSFGNGNAGPAADYRLLEMQPFGRPSDHSPDDSFAGGRGDGNWLVGLEPTPFA